MKYAYILIVFLIIALPATAQDSKDHIRQGNKYYNDKKYGDAEVEYRKSIEADKNNLKADYNLANSLYKQEKYDEAAGKYMDLSRRDLDDETKAKVYHNLGNSLLKSKKYAESIDAYKNSLKMNPKDDETKYNLEYARKMIVQQQQQQQQKQNKDQQKKDDKKDQKKQDQKQDKQDNKDQDKDKQQQQQQQKDKISKEDAQRILQSLNNDEKKLQKKLNKKVKAGKNKNIEKKW
jgi:hypothetical protein